MRIRLLAFATARDAIGSQQIELVLPDGATIEDLATRLRRDYPKLRAVWPRLAVAVDGELVEADTDLHPGCEVALLPPVSGGAPDTRVHLVDGPIDLEALSRETADPSCGALLMFVGAVRARHHDRTVTKITYDAYRPMALRALESIITELEASSPGLRLGIVHRLGETPVGEASVVIAAASPHRAAAYDASRQALERLKREAPIWKQEHYADGEWQWREEEPLTRPLRPAPFGALRPTNG
jgi:molybdopterin synthase catalytic subunit